MKMKMPSEEKEKAPFFNVPDFGPPEGYPRHYVYPSKDTLPKNPPREKR